MFASTSRASSSLIRARAFSHAAVHSKDISKSSAYASPSAFAPPTISQPSDFSPVRDRKNPLTKALHSLENAAEALDVVHALRVCTQMKRMGLKPTNQFYRLLMGLLEEKGCLNEVEALFDDALKLGVTPNREMWNHLLKARARDPLQLFETVESMRLSGHLPNSTTYRIIIQHHAQTRNLIMCLRAIEEMKRAELAPDMQTVETVVKLACEEYLPRLAHGLAIEYEQASTRQLTLECWTRVLAASAHGYYNEGVVDGWKRVVVDGGITPDEGLLTGIINSAGLAGLPTLVESAISELLKLNVSIQEYHVAPLILAMTHQFDISGALDVFDLMDHHAIIPTRFTARALTKLLTSNPEHLQVAVEHLRHRAQSGKKNLASAFNVVLAATLKDQSNYTVLLGKEMDDLRVVPTVDTYNILIHSACLRRNTTLVHTYYSNLLNRKLIPNKETYERIIVLLTGDPVYDDAFLYLNKMENQGLKVSEEVLVGLAKKCAIRFDSRWKSCVRIMERFGYEVTDELMEFCVTNGGKRQIEGLPGEQGDLEDSSARVDFR